MESQGRCAGALVAPFWARGLRHAVWREHAANTQSIIASVAVRVADISLETSETCGVSDNRDINTGDIQRQIALSATMLHTDVRRLQRLYRRYTIKY